MNTSKLAFGAIVGAGVGIIAGILTAPKSGKQTRDDLLRKAEDTRDKAAKTRDELIFKAEEAIDDIKAKAVEAIDAVSSTKRK